MKQYSDYYKVVEGYLKNYSKFKIAIENLEENKQAKLFQLSDCATPISKYGEGGGFGGESNMSQPEAMTAKRMKLIQEAKNISGDIEELKRLIARIDRAINGLEPDRRQAVVLYYIEQLDWWKIADEMHYSAKWCRNLKDQAIQDICLMIFGIKACPADSKFCFMS